MRAAPEIATWLDAIEAPLTIGAYAYLDGAQHVRVAAAMNAIQAAIAARRGDTTLALLATPTDAYAVPAAALRAARGTGRRGRRGRSRCDREPGRMMVTCAQEEVRMRIRFVAFLIATLAATATFAHHGWSGYDAEKTLTLTGTIEASGYEHPHGFIRLQTADKTWLAVLAPPYRMENRGLPREWLKPGTRVTVIGYPHRTDANEMRAERIVVNGKTVELR